MAKRLFIFVSVISLVTCSFWLAVVSISHAQMKTSDGCVVSVSAAECAGTPKHTLHVLAHQIDSLALSGTTIPADQLLLLRLLAGIVAVSLLGLTWSQLQISQSLRQSIRFRQLLVYTAEQRFRAWRVTIQELHPLLIH